MILIVSKVIILNSQIIGPIDYYSSYCAVFSFFWNHKLNNSMELYSMLLRLRSAIIVWIPFI